MCDTFVVTPSATADGSTIFGKNSDREPNEAQVLEYHSAKNFPEGEFVRCTHIEIPQVSETFGVLLSHPFWMWGAEMGVNERGVVIGNEAVWTKMPLSRERGLTGMDLLRLALERSPSAERALEVITDLLAEHGQGGVCGYEDRKLTYHNSFIIADLSEAWVLETAGSLWAARRVKEMYSISNGLTIGEQFDLSHPYLIEIALQKGWLKRGRTFNFADCYADWFYHTFTACRPRRRRSKKLLVEEQPFEVKGAFALLRDHGGEKLYRPDRHFLMNHLCAHSANTLSRHATQSTASLVAHLSSQAITVWVTGTSAPCTGIFKPLSLDGSEFPDFGPKPEGKYNPETLWWRHEKLHRAMLLDFPSRLATIHQDREQLETNWLENPPHTSVAFQESLALEEEWLERISTIPVKENVKLSYRRYWRKQNQKAGISV
ncbi:MAG: C69 family dipeptidase [Fidelibacterota bacterium]